MSALEYLKYSYGTYSRQVRELEEDFKWAEGMSHFEKMVYKIQDLFDERRTHMYNTIHPSSCIWSKEIYLQVAESILGPKHGSVPFLLETIALRERVLRLSVPELFQDPTEIGGRTLFSQTMSTFYKGKREQQFDYCGWLYRVEEFDDYFLMDIEDELEEANISKIQKINERLEGQFLLSYLIRGIKAEPFYNFTVTQYDDDYRDAFIRLLLIKDAPKKVFLKYMKLLFENWKVEIWPCLHGNQELELLLQKYLPAKSKTRQ